MAEILRTVDELRARVAGWKAQGGLIGVVMTMGALHEGHLGLVRAAKAGADRVVVTIFVNPRQFNSPEDLLKYPRTLDADAALLATVGVDAIYAPLAEQVYPPGFATGVAVTGLSDTLEGAFRPGHFDGMATVVTKLIGMTQADRSWFGEKDWQQLQIVRRLVADLNLLVEILSVDTVRDAEGLALSSRNARLSSAARRTAPALHRAMTAAATVIRAGAEPDRALDDARAAVIAAGFETIDYLDLRDALHLAPVTQLTNPARILAAAWLDGVRLIDNIPV